MTLPTAPKPPLYVGYTAIMPDGTELLTVYEPFEDRALHHIRATLERATYERWQDAGALLRILPRTTNAKGA